MQIFRQDAKTTWRGECKIQREHEKKDGNASEIKRRHYCKQGINIFYSSREHFKTTCTCSSQFWMFAVSVNRRIWKPYMPETRLPTKRPNRERRKNGREFSKREVTQTRFSSSERGLRSLNVRKRKLFCTSFLLRQLGAVFYLNHISLSPKF